MGLHVHRAERADRLVGALADLLRVPLVDPFMPEIVSVPTRGVERWLGQQLSQSLGASAAGGDGICAGIDFPSPERLVTRATASALTPEPDDPGSSTESHPEQAWTAERLVWPLLAVMDQGWGEPWGAPLWAYLTRGLPGERDSATPYRREDGIRAGRRWATAARLAGLLAGYASARPSMVLAWLDGRDVDGLGSPLGPDVGWQPELYRRLRSRLGPSPAEQLPLVCARLAADATLGDLPDRISVFGPTRVDPSHLAVLAALAEARQVHLWLTHPSPSLWAAIAAHLRVSGPPGPLRSEDPTVELARSPLLAYLGRDVRELQLVLGQESLTSDQHHPADLGPPGPDAPGSLLLRLQRSLVDNCAPRDHGHAPRLTPGDRSVQVHACHGPDRQVEVLREVLLGLLADDPSLEPRDLVVMCPDIETFAPLISASFGLEEDDHLAEHPGHRLRVRLADRSLRRVNPLLAALGRLLELPDTRASASALLDLAAMPPVAAKFGFSADDLDRMDDLITRSGVRWGLDASYRQAYGLGDFGQNTWAAGLERLLLGVAMDESGDHYLGTALPLDDVDAADVDLVGRIAEFVARLRHTVATFSSRQPVAGWVQACRSALQRMTLVGRGEEWQVAAAYGELAALAESDSLGAPELSSDAAEVSSGAPELSSDAAEVSSGAPELSSGAADSGEGLGADQAGIGVEGAGGPTLLSRADVRAMLAVSFRGRASRANFRTGTLTVCTLLPMRSVPHRVICLLGVDDGTFPRHAAVDGDDIAARHALLGDRDPRSEDRQLLLDAVLAAEDHLVIVYAGADARTGARRPAAPPIAELFDTLDGTATVPSGRVRDAVTTVHPLQPFDPANFRAGPGQVPFSFDPAGRRAAASARRPRGSPDRAMLAQPTRSIYATDGLTPHPRTETVALPELVRFFSHPARTLLRARAGIVADWDEGGVADDVPVTLDGLQAWAIGDRLLSRRLEGRPIEALAATEWRRGLVPPRTLGSRALAPVLETVAGLAEAASPLLSGPRTSRDVLALLPDRRVEGTVASLYQTALVTVSYARLSAKLRLQSWLQLLALTVAAPDTSWRAVSMGRGGRSTLGPVEPDWASRVLADLVELYESGLDGPVPMPPRASAEYARIAFEAKSFEALRGRVEHSWTLERDAAWECFFGPEATLDALLAEPSRAAEERGALAEPSRFGTLARRVWHPLLTAEVLG